jgi:hypothetical protein
MIRRRPIPTALAVLAFLLCAGTASAAVATWNSGFNGWWPGGFGYPPITVQANGYPCSVTVYGPTFDVMGGAWNQNYGGGVSCAGGVGEKTLTIYDQVQGPDGRTWFTITGSTFTTGPTSINPVRMIRNRAAFLGHAYRAVASTRLVVPNGHAGCSLTNTCSQTITITAISRPLAP